jgi:ketosteroid isomerase-like protein
MADFRSGKLKVESVKIGETTIHVYGGAAVVSSRVAVKGQFAGRDITGPYQFTDTWVRRGGRWVAAARQQTGVASQALPAVKEFFARFGKGDIPAVLNTLSVDVDWFIPGPGTIPYAGARKGRKQVGDFFASFNKAVEVQKFEPREFITDRDTVVVLGREVLKVKSTGKVVTNEWTMVFTVKEGSIKKFRSYEDTAALAAAFGTDARRPGEKPPSSK